MFGISIYEFLIILIVAILVIPTRDWPTVFKFLAKCVKFVRNIVWKITDATNELQSQIEREVPINDIIKKTSDEVASAFRTPKPKPKRVRKK